MLSIGTDGRVRRCESHAGKSDCYCAAFSRHAFGKGEGERRVRVAFSHQAGSLGGSIAGGKGGLGGAGGLGGLGTIGRAAPRTKVYVRQSGVTFDEGFDALEKREEALARCFSPGQKLELDLASKLDARGGVAAVTISKGASALSAGEKACVEAAAKTFVYRCPDEEGDEVWGRFSVF